LREGLFRSADWSSCASRAEAALALAETLEWEANG